MSPLLIAVISVVVLILTMQYLVYRSARKHRGENAPEVGGEIGERIKAMDNVVLYFTSAACGICKPVTPIVENLEKEGRNIIKIDIANSMDVARAFNIKATPTWVMIKSGVIDDIMLGAKNGRAIMEMLDSIDER